MNTNKEVEWRRFIMPKKVEQINDHLFIDNQSKYNPLTTRRKYNQSKYNRLTTPSKYNQSKYNRLTTPSKYNQSKYNPLTSNFPEYK